MQSHKKPPRRGAARGLTHLPSITVQDSNTLLTVATICLFASLGGAFGSAVDGMAADLSAGPEMYQGGRAHGE